MKRRVKMRDIVELIVTGNYREFQKKYSLNRRNLRLFKRTLKSGDWKIVDGLGE